MLKLNASYSKKVPAQGDYTSQSYHVSLEVELPDGLSENELKAKIAETFNLARESVESELNGNVQTHPQGYSTVPENVVTTNPEFTDPEPTASNKQVSYLNMLCKQNKVDIKNLLNRFNLVNPFHLTKRQATMLIEELKVA